MDLELDSDEVSQARRLFRDRRRRQSAAPSFGTRIDWFRVIVEIERAGLSLLQIAFACGRSEGWVSYVKTSPGAQPKFHDGLLLLGLWCEVTGKDCAEVPMETELA